MASNKPHHKSEGRKLAPYLREKKAGDFITHEEWNAVIRDLKGQAQRSTGYIEEGVDCHDEKDKAGTKWMQVKAPADETIPAFSLFGITMLDPPYDWDEPPKSRIRKIGLRDSGSHFALMTNGSVEIPMDAWGWARHVGFYETTRLRLTGITPLVGAACGPHLDNLGVCGHNRYGFVCASMPVSQAEGPDLIEVYRTREPVGVIGTVVRRISAYDESEKELGWGRIEVLYRLNNGRRLKRAPDPSVGGAPWVLDVYNICPESFEVGTEVKAEEQTGVGLVVNPPCQESSSSYDSSSSYPSSSVPSSSSYPSSSYGSSSSEEECDRCFPVTGVPWLEDDGCVLVLPLNVMCVGEDGCVTVTEGGTMRVNLAPDCLSSASESESESKPGDGDDVEPGDCAVWVWCQPGKWVLKDGDRDIGEPDVDGRFYGEAVTVCGCSSSSSDSCSPVEGVISPNSPAPQFVADFVIVIEPPGNFCGTALGANGNG